MKTIYSYILLLKSRMPHRCHHSGFFVFFFFIWLLYYRLCDGPCPHLINYAKHLNPIYINQIQQDATVCRYLFTAKLLYVFRMSIAPIIRSTSNCNCSFWYRSQYQSNNFPPAWPNWPCWRKVVAMIVWPVPEVVVTVLCTPDDGCDRHPKHVE